MKLKFFLPVLIVALVAVFIYSQTNKKSFAPAEDFPREAVLYVQIADLPALIKLWNESEFKDKYLESANFKDFQNNHLGRKLASRWQEFSDAAGFPIDLEVLSKLAGNQAAAAIYDVGKLEFVFIAPISDEVFAATKFAANHDKFIEDTFDDGTTIYRATVEADRGRQKQELIYTQLKGRFILTTSEKLLAQTLNNVNGGAGKTRLIDNSSFKILSENIEPHSAIVWINQTVLNDDYYFKHYWLMSDVEDLKNIRAGMFDFEIGTGKFIERRKFLLDKEVEIAPIESAEAAKLEAFLPADIPFYRLRSANPKTIDEAVEKTIFARRNEAKKRRNYNSVYSSFDDYDDNYNSPDEKYDEAIDDTDDDEAVEKREVRIDFSKIFQPANQRAILTFARPKVMSAPLFVEFQQATIINFASPESFNRDAFESAVAQKFSDQMMIRASGVKLDWETKSENNFLWRELKLPMLGWNICYAIRGDELVLTNDDDFFQQISALSNPPKSAGRNSLFNTLTVINFDVKENAYDGVFDELDRQNLASDFFTNNIDSLLDSLSDVKKIEIEENYSSSISGEEITINF